jgi:hypothetical protein
VLKGQVQKFGGAKEGGAATPCPARRQVEGVIVNPLFLDLAPGDAVDEDAAYARPIAGRSVAHELTLVGAVSPPASDHPVTFGYKILDRNPQIRKGATVHAHKTLKTIQATHLSLSTGGAVADEVGSKELVDQV